MSTDWSAGLDAEEMRQRLIVLCKAMHDMYPPEDAKMDLSGDRPRLTWYRDDEMEYADFARYHFEMSDEAFKQHAQLLNKIRLRSRDCGLVDHKDVLTNWQGGATMSRFLLKLATAVASVVLWLAFLPVLLVLKCLPFMEGEDRWRGPR